MGSAYKNKGVQLLLDGVRSYLPSPLDVINRALDVAQAEAPLELPCDPAGALAARPSVVAILHMKRARQSNDNRSPTLQPLLTPVNVRVEK